MKSFYAPRIVDLGESFAQNNQSLFVGMFYIVVMPNALALSMVGLVLQVQSIVYPQYYPF
jgi:hypothetical protein